MRPDRVSLDFKPVRQVFVPALPDLFKEVWGYEYDGGGSNVVDSVTRSLRKKLNHHAAAIETVTGLGYRFRGF
ncbi:MAG: winged helix-turn-helix transcriptional regulator [Anaerolineales bacterium]|nr:winged helix-turn-helix transcriptional regulator [Anaerolineales bacterium]